jgi:FMN phosphatase YigB (HAD superfamily)
MERIVFDLIGVLTKESYFATKTLYPLIKDKISYDQFKKRYILYCVGLISNKEFWEDVVEEEKIAKFEHKLFKNIVKYDNTLISLIKELEKEGMYLYLASEIPHEWGDLMLKILGIESSFRNKFYSSKIRHTKPFLKFFKKVFESDELKDKDLFYIDDTEVNLKAISKYKFTVKTILYSPNLPETISDKHILKAKNASELKHILYEENR